METIPAYSKWTADFISESLGDAEVGLYSSTQSDPGKTLTTPTTRMKFSDYMRLIRREPTDLRLFLFPVFKYKPELLKDFGYPDITRGYIKLPFMFFGPTGSITRMHQDIDMSNVFPDPVLKAGRGWSCFLLIKAGYCINSFQCPFYCRYRPSRLSNIPGACLCRRNDRCS